MDTTLLPAAIKGDKRALSVAARTEIAALYGPRPWAFTGTLIRAWIVIVGVIVWADFMDAAWASAIAIFLIATRQNVLGLLVHDQAHLLGYRNRFGDLAVNCFAAYPLLVLTVEGYAQVHLAHHRNYFGKADPDFMRKNGEEWSFPKRRGELFKLFLTDVVGINVIRLVRGKRPDQKNPLFVRRHPVPLFVRPLYLLVVAATLTLTGTWFHFLVYWLLPLLTITQLIIRWGAICEHKYNLPGASVADSTPLIVLSWWERLLLPNLNFAMHPYHHYFPGVAFSQLPTIHRIFEREGLIDDRHVFRGNLAYLRHLVGNASTHRSGEAIR